MIIFMIMVLIQMIQQGLVIEVIGLICDCYDEIFIVEVIVFFIEFYYWFVFCWYDCLVDWMCCCFEIGNGYDFQFCEDIVYICQDIIWCVVGVGLGFEDCCVEIIGFIDLKMMINVFNFGVWVWFVDQEDVMSFIWKNVIEGQLFFCDVICGVFFFIFFEGKEYCVMVECIFMIVMCFCGWYLFEKYIVFIDCVGCCILVFGFLVDFGFYFLYNVQVLIEVGCGFYFYIVKFEFSEEVKLWDDVFFFSEEYIGILYGMICVIVLIEMLLVVFEMDEIFYELCDYCVGLNVGCWDYIFLIIKNY